MTYCAGKDDEAPRCVPEKWKDREKLREAAGKNATASNLLIIYLDGWQPFGDWQKTHGKPWSSIKSVCRVVVLCKPPLNPHCLLTWRNALIDEEYVAAARCVTLPAEQPKDGWEEWLNKKLEELGWSPKDSKQEKSFVTIKGDKTRLQFDGIPETLTRFLHRFIRPAR